MSYSRIYGEFMGATDSWAIHTIDATFDLYQAVLAEFDRLTAGSELTPALARALWAIDPGPLSRRDLAQRLRCDPSNVTFLADRLVAQGLVARVPDPADGRVRALQLTPVGRTTRARIARGLAIALRPDGVAEHQLARLRSTICQPADAKGVAAGTAGPY